jgi:hypothetical protein
MPDLSPPVNTARRAAQDAAEGLLARPAPRPEPLAGTSAGRAPGHAVLQLLHLHRRHVPWALARLALGARSIGAHAGLRAVRVLGSGRGGGFGLAPGLRHQGLFAMFDDEASAIAFAEGAAAVRDGAARSEESLLAVLAVTSSRGSWGGVSMQPVRQAAAGEPVAVLTRASVRLRHAATFWGHSPASERALARAVGCRLAAGLGEAPLLRQATFSLWDSAQALQAYARHGAHGDAARHAMGDGWFSEWMFVRFSPLSLRGCWQGRDFG